MNYYEELGKINKKIERLQRCKANCGSNSAVVIEVTKAQFLALVGNSTLTFPATYKITDVDNGLYVETFSNNTFSTSATLSLFVPDYVASGVNLGQMDAVTIPTIAANDMVIWGDHYWVNETASPITPTIIDVVTLDGGLTQIVKESGSIYNVIEYPCQIDAALNVISVSSNTGSTWSISSAIANDGGNGSHIYAQLNDALVTVDNLVSTFNQKGILIASSPFIQGEVIVNNSAKMINIFINGNSNEVSGNKSSGEGSYDNINLVNTSRLKDNDISGASFPLAQIAFIELFDNAECNNNTVIGDGAIWDIRTGEETKVNGNIVDCGVSPTPFFTNGTIQDIDQMYQDECSNNELYGELANIAMIHQFGFSKLNSNILNGQATKIRFIRQSNSELNKFTLNTINKSIERLELRGAILQNGNDISITDCEFSSINIDFTGFAVDISNEVIEANKGWFTITRDFDTTPLVDGVPELHNIIPIGASITSIKAKGSITSGTSLTIGLETDDASLISQVVANYAAGQTYNGISAVATANRSLRLVSVGNLNAGSVTILVEFMI